VIALYYIAILSDRRERGTRTTRPDTSTCLEMFNLKSSHTGGSRSQGGLWQPGSGWESHVPDGSGEDHQHGFHRTLESDYPTSCGCAGTQELVLTKVRMISLAKTQVGLEAQLSLCQTYHNLCLPHSSLRLPLPEPQPTRGDGSPRKCPRVRGGMAAGVTGHIWRMEELLLFRPPPWRQPMRMVA